MPELHSKYMKVAELPRKGKTRHWEIRTTGNFFGPGAILGSVHWYSAWRQYCFVPRNGIVFNNGCLTSLAQFLNAANREHKEKAAATADKP